MIGVIVLCLATTYADYYTPVKHQNQPLDCLYVSQPSSLQAVDIIAREILECLAPLSVDEKSGVWSVEIENSSSLQCLVMVTTA